MTIPPAVAVTEEECEAFLARSLGEELTAELVQAMLDVATPAINLPFARDGHLGQLRDTCLDLMRSSLALQNEGERRTFQQRMPWQYQEPCDLATAILIMGTNRAYLRIPESVFGPPSPGSRVIAAIPSLADRFDDDGLLDCTGVNANSHALLVDQYAVHYHQFLRRGFQGTINDRLLNVLMSAAQRAGNRLRLAIDDRRLTTPAEFVHMIEEDYWYGPHLTEEWLDDPLQVGRTVHRDPEGDEALRGFSAFFAYWRMDGEGHKVVQMEELESLSQKPVCELRVIRYFHSIRDIQSHEFIHCDGAVRAYTPDGYLQRSKEEMPAATQADRYRKVFRIDGSVTTQEWSDIVAKWFRHNHLATEYLQTLSADQEAD